MINTAKLLDIPILFTEQYPEKLGKTVDELDTQGAVAVLPKTLFSMCLPETDQHLQNKKTVILCGIEAHVCVQQTALDLAAAGFEVQVLADAVSSQTSYDRSVAFERMRQTPNIFITTSQSLIFDLARDAKHTQFKKISALQKEARKDPQL